MFDVLMILGALAAVVSALPVLGFDIRITGKNNPSTEGEGYANKAVRRRAWIALVLSASCLLGIAADIYYRTRPMPPVDIHHNLGPITDTIADRNFVNERVEVDGKRFLRCHFTNVTLIYHGLANFEVTDPVIRENFLVDTDNEAVKGFQVFINGLGQMHGLEINGIFGQDANGNLIPLPKPPPPETPPPPSKRK